MSGSINEFLQVSNLTVREFGVYFARLIAGLEVDPHGYFEKKYAARIEHAQSETEINGVLTQLVQWAVSPAVSDQQRKKLDTELSKRELPTVAELRLIYLP